ncbi:hypothetical protein F5880DRAFT_1511554, partial [Lentinula raphanica]
MSMEAFTHEGSCTPKYYPDSIPGLVQAQRAHEYYVITDGSFAGIYKYCYRNLAKDRANRSGKTAHGVASFEAACNLWSWTCKEYHKHDNRDVMGFSAPLLLKGISAPPMLSKTSQDSSSITDDANTDNSSDDNNLPAVDKHSYDAKLNDLNKYSKPNPIAFSTKSGFPKSSASKFTFSPPPTLSTENLSAALKAKGKSSRSRSQSPTKASAKNPSKPPTNNIDSISAQLSKQSIRKSSTAGKASSSRAESQSKLAQGLYVVKWEGSYELHSDFQSAKDSFEQALLLQNETQIRSETLNANGQVVQTQIPAEIPSPLKKKQRIIMTGNPASEQRLNDLLQFALVNGEHLPTVEVDDSTKLTPESLDHHLNEFNKRQRRYAASEGQAIPGMGTKGEETALLNNVGSVEEIKSRCIVVSLVVFLVVWPLDLIERCSRVASVDKYS